MKWTPGRRSPNIEDRRGARGVGRAGVGVGGGVLLLVLSLLFGRNLFEEVQPAPGGTVATTQSGDVAPVSESPEERERAQFVSFVLDDAQETWARLFQQSGGQYQDAKLVLFRNVVASECGVAESAAGPFYCPLDQKAYIDLGFYDELRDRFGAQGDFAQAYVLAHELGHHVQNLLGTAGEVRQLQQARPSMANELSVRLELQADCYAGVWANSTRERQLLEQGDVEEALGAASAVGDDRIQSRTGGSINPESFTHGTAAERASWFQRGFASGNPESCDTFSELE